MMAKTVAVVRFATNTHAWFRLLIRVMLLALCLATAAALIPEHAPDVGAEAWDSP
jgi:hypothetical protein